MERIISDDERIKRAEDVMLRRKNMIESDNINTSVIHINKISKVIIKLIICLCIYCGLYYIRNNQNESNNKIINNLKSVLSYDINLNEIYSKFSKYFDKTDNALRNNDNLGNKANNTDANLMGEKNGEEIKETKNEDIDTQSKSFYEEKEDGTEKKDSSIESIALLGIGGELENEYDPDETSNEITNEDVWYIKNNIGVCKPIEEYVVTSRFGKREGSSMVSSNHKGIDLGAATGTVIKSASKGVVIEASNIGDFGLHLKIKQDDIVAIYGHCSELMVSEGDKVNIGDEIAKVGATGKATGPHLHFEIRRDDRPVDPELILEF